MMAIKSMTPRLFLGVFFLIYGFHSDIIARNIGDVIRHIMIISDNFFVARFFDFFLASSSY